MPQTRWDHDHNGSLPDHLEVWGHDRVICPQCRYRWVAVRTLATAIEVLECPACSGTGAELQDEINLSELTRQ